MKTRKYIKSPIFVGDIYPTKAFGDAVVIEYQNYKNVKVMFLNSGSMKWVRGDHIKEGAIRDDYQPTVFGVGIVAGLPVKLDGRLADYYNYWSGILERCYSSKFHEKYPTYIGCTICDEWKLLPNFKEWFDVYHRAGWEIDKDLLVKGNKVYSPETCRFIPKSLNNLIKENRKTRGDCCIGVLYREGYKDPYLAQLSVDNQNVHLGCFSTETEAFLCYKLAKESHVKSKASLLYSEGKIDELLYQKLSEYEVTEEL